MEENCKRIDGTVPVEDQTGTAAQRDEEFLVRLLLQTISRQMSSQTSQAKSHTAVEENWGAVPSSSRRKSIARLRQEVDTALAGHQQFGQLNPRPGGLTNRAVQAAKKVMRRSLAWYTRPNHVYQAAVIRALQEIAAILERQDRALTASTNHADSLTRSLAALRSDLKSLESEVREIPDANPATAGKAPWEIQRPQVTTEADILACFRLILGRSPMKEEWPGHSLMVGETLGTVVSSYLSSREFADRQLTRSLGQCELVELPHGKLYASREDTLVGREIIDTGEYEPELTRVFREYLRPGMDVLDIGANIGYFSLLAASLVGPSGVVYSWEPSPANVKMIYASQMVNQFSNIEIIQAAASDRLGLLRYFRSLSNGSVGDPARTGPENILSAETVMGLRIDDVIPQNAAIGFVKVDIEGHEFKAMSGATKTLERCRPVIASEFSPLALEWASGVSGRQYLEFFAQLGYRPQVITEQGAVAATIDDVLAQHERSGTDHIDLLLLPDRPSSQK